MTLCNLVTRCWYNINCHEKCGSEILTFNFGQNSVGRFVVYVYGYSEVHMKGKFRNLSVQNI